MPAERTNRTSKKEILMIMGNGFDLSCGLKSTYEDFFNYRFRKQEKGLLNSIKRRFEAEKERINFDINRNNIDINGHIYDWGVERRQYLSIKPNDPNTEFNFWDLILYYGYSEIPERWNDVESRIAEFLVYEGDTKGKKIKIPNYTEMTENKYRSILKNNSYFYSKLIIYSAGVLGLEREVNIKQLIGELNKLEREFEKYLDSIINQEYYQKAEKLLIKLLGVEEEIPSRTQEYKVITFNYTTPLLNKSREIRGLGSLNVHGKVGSNDIIFGIDQEKIQATDKRFLFAKTYRSLIQKKDKFGEKKAILANINKIEKIIFYGHSLSQADKSYFQSIFDYYQIYDNPISLIFYYHNYDSRKDIQQEQVLNVTGLLKEYGETIGNDYRGDNLMHKLLLENRLFVTETELPEWNDM